MEKGEKSEVIKPSGSLYFDFETTRKNIIVELRFSMRNARPEKLSFINSDNLTPRGIFLRLWDGS